MPKKPKIAEVKPVSERDAWVLERPDGFVLRRYVPGSELDAYAPGVIVNGWWESSLTSVDVVKMALERHPEKKFLACAVRVNEDTGERHVALIERSRLDTMGGVK